MKNSDNTPRFRHPDLARNDRSILRDLRSRHIAADASADDLLSEWAESRAESGPSGIADGYRALDAALSADWPTIASRLAAHPPR